VIRTFKSKKLRKLFEDGEAHGLPADQVSRIENRLAVLDAASTIEDCNVAGFKLHALKGDYKGFYSVWVTGNWRIVFRFVKGDVFDVDHVDYH
jgi:proteic killer suppression protein